MTRFLIRRLLQVPVLLLILSAVVFLVAQLAPGDPSVYFLPDTADPVMRQRIIERLGLDQPIHVRYWQWLTSAVQGDFGNSFRYGQSVSAVISERLATSLILGAATVAFSALIGIPLGILAGLKQNTRTDRAISAGSLFGLSMPDFWFALLLTLVFALHLGWLPSSGLGSGSLWEQARSYIMPVVTLSLALLPWYSRFMRSGIIGVMDSDFVRTARAKGVREPKVITRHMLRMALPAVITIFALSLRRMVGGAVVVETVFALPGLGRLAYDSVVRHDYPVIMALVLLSAAFIILVNLLTDVIYTWLDPRVDLRVRARSRPTPETVT